MPSEVVPKDFLMAIINEARLHHIPKITVRSILLDLDLLSIDLVDDEVRILADRKAFSETIGRMRKQASSPAIDDLPNYEDLRSAVWNTVMLPDEVVRPIFDEIKGMQERTKDPYRHPKQMAFAIDTNIAYYRLFTRMFLKSNLLELFGFRPEDLQIIVSNLVEEEISHAIARKYSRGDINELQKVVRDQVLTNAMNNICHRQGRKALNAQAEIDALGRMSNVWRVGGARASDNKEENDDEIVRSLALHSADQRMDVLFVTADDKCRAHAFSHKLPSILVVPPNELPESVEFDPWLLVELLHDLSINFVGLHLPEPGIKIIGGWSGKSTEDFHRELIKVIAISNSPIKDRVHTDLDIIREIELIESGASEIVN